MKNKIKLFAISLLLFMIACTPLPKIEEVEKETKDSVEELLSEYNNKEVVVRLDKYVLYAQTNDLTYKGGLDATAFYKTSKWDWNKHQFVEYIDSLKLYKDVVINFRDKKYNSWVIVLE